MKNTNISLPSTWESKMQKMLQILLIIQMKLDVLDTLNRQLAENQFCNETAHVHLLRDP